MNQYEITDDGYKIFNKTNNKKFIIIDYDEIKLLKENNLKLKKDFNKLLDLMRNTQINLYEQKLNRRII